MLFPPLKSGIHAKSSQGKSKFTPTELATPANAPPLTMAGIFKTFSPKLNPKQIMTMSGDSMKGMPSKSPSHRVETA